MASTSRRFSSADAHRAALKAVSRLPLGFKVGTAGLEFQSPVGDGVRSMRLTAIMADKPVSSFAAVTTRNLVCGAPIHVLRNRLQNSNTMRGIIINNRVSNVAAKDGVSAAEAVCTAAAKAFGFGAHAGDTLVPLSTGIIGWPIPVNEMVAAMPELAKATMEGTMDAFDAAKSIMTTDQWPKVRSANVAGGGRVVGIAKGAGMIEPNMATMLSVIMTDARVSRASLQAILSRAIEAKGSLNSCSVDSDTSTSDAVVAMSSQMATPLDGSKLGLEFEENEASIYALEAAITDVLQHLSHDIVRNGEGIYHVMRVNVINAPDDATARLIGKSVVNSPLLKCAVAADDPNIGRLASSVGKGAMNIGFPLNMNTMQLSIGGRVVMANGHFDTSPATEEFVTAHMSNARLAFEMPPAPPYPNHENCVEITVDLASPGGTGSALVYGGDLTHEYVSVNAEYRT